MICARCGLRGHKAIDCSNKARKKQYCRTCDLFNHDDDNCPNIWRSYLLNKQPQQHSLKDVQLPVIYCYNCGDSTHFGDECKEARTSRVPNLSGSAFSGSNLPQQLRKTYFDRLFDTKLPQRPQVRRPDNGYKNSNNRAQFKPYNNNPIVSNNSYNLNPKRRFDNGPQDNRNGGPIRNQARRGGAGGRSGGNDPSRPAPTRSGFIDRKKSGFNNFY
ncbi:hypothetical protein PSN45_002834 [Yamadazyma tenuis]|nr:hypothetical protein PSN45_002834 [Yamadazyma tenuis]